MKLITNKNYFITTSIFVLYNLLSFFKESFVFFLIFLSVFLIILKSYRFENRQTLAESFLFTNLLTTIIPPRLVFSGNQFAYFDEHFVDKLLFKSEVYSSNIPYVGFSYLSKILLWPQNLEVLNSFLFFLNCFVFYGIFSMFKLISENLKTHYFFYISLFLLFVAINLPSNFNSLMGVPKLFLNGTASFGSLGIRIFTPASFDLLMFIPMKHFYQKKLIKAIFTGLLISLFHYYLFVILFIFLLSYLLSTKGKDYYIYFIFIFSLGVFNYLSNIKFFKNLSEIFQTIKPTSANFNLVEYFSIGSIINNGLNSNFVYYFDLLNLRIFKPDFVYKNFSPTIGVINNQSSIPIEKMLLFSVAYFISLKFSNRYLSSLVFVSSNIFLASHFLYSYDIFSFVGLIYPWRITHIISITSFLILMSKMPQISFEVRDIYLFSFLVLIPASFYLWNIYDSRDYDYNDNLKIIIEESFEKNELIIIPIEETRYLYHYGLPNVYIWLYPNLEFRNLDKTIKYYEDLNTTERLIFSESCQDFLYNLDKIDKDIKKIILSKNSKLFGKNCDSKLIFYDD